MAAQKILELKESNSLIESASTLGLDLVNHDPAVNELGISKLKGVLKFSLSVVYFTALVYFLVKLLT